MSKDSNTTPFGWVIILTGAIIPLIFFKDTVEGMLIPRTVLWSVLASAGAISLFFSKAKVQLPQWSVLWLGFTLWMFATGFMANIYSAPEWLLTSSRFALYASVLLSTQIAITNNQLHYRDLSRALVLMGLVGGILGLREFAFHDNLLEIGRPFGHKNFLSAAMLISLLGSMYTVWHKHSQWRVIAIVSMCVSLVLVILLRTRGVWIASFLSAVFILLAMLVFRSKEVKEFIIPKKYLSLGLGLLLMGIIGVAGFSENKEEIREVADIEFRFTYWDHSMQMASEHPLTGVGAGQWQINFPKYGLENTNTRVSNGETAILRPHNDFFWMLSEGGWIGLILYAGFFIAAVIVGTRKLMADGDSEHRMIHISAVSIVIAFCAYAMGEFPIERVDIAVPVFMAIAFIFNGSKSYNLTSSTGIGLSLIAAIFSLYISFERFSNEELVYEIAMGNNEQNPTKILNAYEQVNLSAVNLDGTANPLVYFAGLSNLYSGQTASNQRQVELAKEQFEEALTIHPWHIPTFTQYGNYYRYQKKYNEALEMYNRGLSVSPYSVQLRLNKAEIYLLMGKPDGCALMLLNFEGMENNQKYQGLAYQSLIAIKGESTIPVVNDFLQQTDIETLSPPQLFNAFIRYRNSLRPKK